MASITQAQCRTTVSQRRQRVLDEIVDVARAQLRAQEAASISSVAAAMGITPPALYRYVPNIAGLNTLITKAILDDLMGLLKAAADRQSDSPAKLVAVATAFRQWALNNYAEYRAAFAPQGGPLSRQSVTSGADLASFAFAEVLVDAVSTVPPRPGGIAVSDSYRRSCARLAECNQDLMSAHTPEQLWVFERAWVKFLGVVSYEAFGFLDPEVVVSGDMFVSQMIEIGETLGLASDIDRLLAIAVETATWFDEKAGVQPLHIQYAINQGQPVPVSDHSLLLVHTQPDDESSQTPATMTRYVAKGAPGAGKAYLFAGGVPFPASERPATDIFAGLT